MRVDEIRGNVYGKRVSQMRLDSPVRILTMRPRLFLNDVGSHLLHSSCLPSFLRCDYLVILFFYLYNAK